MRLNTTNIVLIGIIVVLGLALIYMWSMMGSKDGFRKTEDGGDRPKPPAAPRPSVKPEGSPSGSTRLDSETQGPSFLLLHATWCPHCVAMLPEWKKLEKMLDGKLEVLDLESKHADMAKFNPQGFPTIRFYPHGTSNKQDFVEYKGPRTADAMAKFALNGGR